ncbi:UNVERIFIED_CONTAM: hypothetical protein B566_EDAN019421, partial [Ephemera danica]
MVNEATVKHTVGVRCVQKRREECERKARRGEMDPRLEFTFQLLIDATGLTRADIMDHVFEGNMLDEINQLFLPHMRNTLLWYYQEGLQASTSAAAHHHPPKKKLFLTDGWSVPLTGICIYMFRLNTSKQLPEEGFHKDLFCGIIDVTRVGLVSTIERIVEHVFMEALAHPAPDAEDDEASCPMVRNQLLPGLRSFCSALRVCEEVCNERNIFDDDTSLVSHIQGPEDARALANGPDEVMKLEERLKLWMKRVHEVVMESQQLRRENDSSGPQDELEYWKRRGAQFSQIVTHLQSHESLKQWRELDKKITFCYNEARDNAKFIQSMEKCCHSLYLHDPVQMKDSILSLLQTVRLIHSVSKFYNTTERTSSFMVKITNQMIETCKLYVTCRGKETIWSQTRTEVREKLTHCINLNQVYHSTYITVKNQPFLPGLAPFGFSENYVFGKFDTFCDRLSKIIQLFDLVDDYNTLFERRMEGLLLGEALEESMRRFEDAKKGIMNKPYDYLDHRNKEFDEDYENFMAAIDAMKESIGNMIEENFASVWETPQGIKFLVRFEKVSEKIPLTKMDEKYDRVLKYCEKEVERILKLFRKQRDDPLLPRNFPPIAGRIKWVRSLQCHLQDLVQSVSAHPILQNLTATAELVRRYATVATTLHAYEQEMIRTWTNHNISMVDEGLKQTLLALCPKTGRLRVNLDYRLTLLIREADCMAKMNLPVPVVARALLSKRSYFTLVNDTLQ